MFAFRQAIVAGMLAIGFGALAQEPPNEPAPAPEDQAAQEAEERAEMRREVEEAVQAINAYTIARKDDAAQRARVAMERMDQRIARIRAAWAEEAERIRTESQASRERDAAMIRERDAAMIRERRDALQERYRAMEHSNAEAWAQARDRFVRAYRDLADALGAGSGEAEDEDGGKDEQPEQQR